MSTNGDTDDLRDETRRQWNAKAAFWDEQIGDGNQTQLVLVGPAVEQLLDVQPGELVLDIACGNGVFARRMAALGARVVAGDFSKELLERARARSNEHAERIEYLTLDATNDAQLLALGEARFGAVVCNQALHDIADIGPLARALPRLLKLGGRFVFSVPHPAFNFASGTAVGQEEFERDGRLESHYYVKVLNYLRVPPTAGVGIVGEPAVHTQFHRPLSELLTAFFDAGLVLDAMLEPSYGPEHSSKRPLGWANFKDIAPFLIARMRRVHLEPST